MTVTDVSVGSLIPEFRVEAVDGEHIRQLALILRDPNPIHFDLDAVARAGMGDREINQGGATMAYIIDMLASWTGSSDNMTRIQCRFRGNVRAGDTVIAGGKVTHLADGLAECTVWADLDDGTRVIDGTAAVRID